jgi:hypothetical protein
MNINKIFAVIAIVSVLLDACTLTLTPTPIVPVTGATPESIGEISAEKTLVESGPSEALDRVSDTRQFFNHDTVRVTNGGTAKLDFFVNQISIRLFNDTAVGDIKADPSGTPDRAVRMKLVFGGLSGEVTKNGIPIYFEITNGVNIYVLGTQFLVLYDPNNGTTYIGNFDGTVAYSIPGQPSVQFIQAGQLYEISPSFETRTVIMNFTRTDIENLTLDRRSTLLDALENYLAITATPTSTTPPLSPINTLTATPVSTITPAQTEIISCDRAAFVTDVTVPDGTPFTPGSQFTKVWRLRNVGTCTWTNGYSLVFYGGQQMDGPVSINIPSLVAPGQTIDIPIGLVAPLIPGSYRGEWILRNAAGAIFGVDANGIGPIWVAINVISIPTITVTAFSTGGITGTAFSDGNSNNVPETGEVAQGLTVTLYNSTGNGMLAVTTTNSAGVYTFLNLSAGTYYVKWVVTGCNQPDAREATVNVSPGGTQIQDLTTSILC